jgi:hypothetical protein
MLIKPSIQLEEMQLRDGAEERPRLHWNSGTSGRRMAELLNSFLQVSSGTEYLHMNMDIASVCTEYQ